MTCKQQAAPGESSQHNLGELIAALRKIWDRIAKNTVTISHTTMPLPKHHTAQFTPRMGTNGPQDMVFNSEDEEVKPHDCANRVYEQGFPKPNKGPQSGSAPPAERPVAAGNGE